MANVETSGIPYYEEPKPVLAGEATMAEMMRRTLSAPRQYTFRYVKRKLDSNRNNKGGSTTTTIITVTIRHSH